MINIDKNIVGFASHLADEADKIIHKFYRQPFDIEKKYDKSPVTIADKTIEANLRKLIEVQYPDDGILGEEFENKTSKSGYTWIVDPIDGTKSFIIGRPTFGTLIALAYDDVPVLGIIDQPIIKDRWIGVRNYPTTHNGIACKTRKCSDLSNAIIATTDPIGQFSAKHEKEVMANLREISSIHAYGSDCYAYGLLASGFVDLVIETQLKPYDFAALVPIVTGAGGSMTDWNGEPLTIKSKGHVIALGDGDLYNNLSFISQ